MQVNGHSRHGNANKAGHTKRAIPCLGVQILNHDPIACPNHTTIDRAQVEALGKILKIRIDQINRTRNGGGCGSPLDL